MIGAEQLAQMKQGACLLNLSRGNVVDIDALAEAIRAGTSAARPSTCSPTSPRATSERFESPLHGLPNVILTPHVGGSTEEAQAAIGKEVAVALLKFLNTGSTSPPSTSRGSSLRILRGRHRILNIHRNVPGVLSSINTIISELNANVESQVLDTNSDVGYLVMDIDRDVSEEVRARVVRPRDEHPDAHPVLRRASRDGGGRYCMVRARGRRCGFSFTSRNRSGGLR